MSISAKTEYAAIAMLELAARYETRQPVRVKDIADQHGIPSRFLVQILLQLKNAGLVNSTRGASGGYQLAKAPEEISLRDISQVVEGPANTLTSNAGGTPTCQVLLETWQAAADAQREVLEGVTLATLVEQVQQQATEMYYI